MDTILAVAQKKNKILNNKEKCIVAYHEIGHALVAALQTNSAPVQKITIVPRTSGALGFTMQVEDGDEVIWCGQLQDSDQIVLLTDRGYAKRLLSVDFEKQNRNGKGVKSFYFNKNGSNGKQLACVVRL